VLLKLYNTSVDYKREGIYKSYGNNMSAVCFFLSTVLIWSITLCVKSYRPVFKTLV